MSLVPDHVPPPSGTPAALGPYAVVGRWHSETGGEVLAGRDALGGEAELVLLAPGPAADPAARDRFVAAVEHLGRRQRGQVLNSQLRGPLVWVALEPGSGPELARPLLAAPLPAGADVRPGAGPAFAPHWSASPQSYPTYPAPAAPLAPAADERPWWRRWWWLLVLVAAVLLLLLLLSACWPEDEPVPQPTPQPVPTDAPTPTASPTPSTGQPSSGPSDGPGASPTPSNQAQGTPEQDLQAGPGVAGPSFTRDDETVQMRLPGLPFPFRVPQGWECVEERAPATVIRYRCTDTTYPATQSDPAPSGLVQVEPCPDPCDEPQWQLLRLTADDDPGWVLVDATTAVALDVDPGRPWYERIRMSRIWAEDGGGPPDTHLFTVFTAPAGHLGEIQKITNDIRANTP